MKQYRQLLIPEDSAWERKSWRRYAPIWLKEILDGIKNIFIWMPVIYKDKNWDHSYIFTILKFKLIKQRKELVNANRHTTVWQTNRDITICLNLIERIQDGYYNCEYQDYIDQKFDFIPSNEKFEGEDTFQLETTVIKKDFIPFFVKYINQYKKLRRYGYLGMKFKKEDDQKIALYLSDVNQQRAQTLLFKILNERINHWWD